MLDPWMMYSPSPTVEKLFLLFFGLKPWPVYPYPQQNFFGSKQPWAMYPPIVNGFHETFRTGLVFSEAVKMSTISPMLWSKLNKNISMLVNSEQIYTKLSEQGLFFQDGCNEYNKCYAIIKTEQKVELSRFSMYLVKYHSMWALSTVITQKLKYTCRWLRFHNNLGGFNSDGILPR